MKPDPPIPNSAPPPVDIVHRGGGCAVGFLFICIGVITACTLLGCKPIKPYPANPSGESVAKSTAFIAAASANIDAAKPDSGKTGKALLTVANDQLSNATNANADASKQMRDMQAGYESRIDALEAKYNKLDAKWYVWLGRKIQLVLILIGTGWLALGILAAFLPFGGIGSTILRVLPVSNPFAWLRDNIIKPGAVPGTKAAKGGNQ